MASVPYGVVLARRIQATRKTRKLSQESVAARMRALGFDYWTRQTVGSTEKMPPLRRVTAAEVVGLALVLEVAVPVLLHGDEHMDEAVAFPTGDYTIESLNKLLMGKNDGSVTWVDDEPKFTRGATGWWTGESGESED